MKKSGFLACLWKWEACLRPGISLQRGDLLSWGAALFFREDTQCPTCTSLHPSHLETSVPKLGVIPLFPASVLVGPRLGLPGWKPS